MPVRLLLCTLLSLLAAPFVRAQTAPADVRVRLFDGDQATRISIRGEDGLRLYVGDESKAVQVLAPEEEATIDVRGQDLFIETGDLSFFALSLRAVPDASAPLMVTVDGPGDESSAHRYAGSFRISVDADRPGYLSVVNRVPLEDYVAAVVAREFSFDALEAAKAMAVAARTYAIQSSGRFGDAYDHVDGVTSQAYAGLDRLTDTAVEAARATRGEIMTYEGEPIEALYFSASGGHTANNEDVFDGQPKPYLRGIADPYDARSPHDDWRATVDRPRLLRALSDAYGFEVDGFHLGDRTRDGRVGSIKLLREDRPFRTISSNEFRLFVNRLFGMTTLRSTLLDARRVGDHYVFEGSGFGHGVGMSQYGALEMARQGYGYRDILQFYYHGIDIESAGTSAPPVATDVSTPSAPDTTETTRTTRRVGW